MKSARRKPSAIFAIPLLIGMALLAGLILGLTGEGARDALAWALAGLAPVTLFFGLLRRTPKRSPN
ncbi:hypothetical protein LCM19_10505 [Qipengyuania flava]|nr:hypothetical protein [Qipengyuania flava]